MTREGMAKRLYEARRPKYHDHEAYEHTMEAVRAVYLKMADSALQVVAQAAEASFQEAWELASGTPHTAEWHNSESRVRWSVGG